MSLPYIFSERSTTPSPNAASEYIIGYINAIDFSFTLNENCAYANEFYL